MLPGIYATRHVDRKTFEGKRSQEFKRTARRYKNQIGSVTHETKDYREKHDKYNVMVADVVMDYTLQPNDEVHLPSTKVVQKRKLSTDEWDWAPYPRKKSQRNDESPSDSDDYLSDEFDDSQTVPNLYDQYQDNSCSSYCDSLSSKATDIQIIRIDEVIEFKSPIEHDLDEVPICFDINKICDVGDYDENSLNDVVHTSRLVIYEDQETIPKDKKEFDPCVDCQDSQAEYSQEELHKDDQIERLNFAKCFQCRRKVIRVTCCY